MICVLQRLHKVIWLAWWFVECAEDLVLIWEGRKNGRKEGRKGMKSLLFTQNILIYGYMASGHPSIMHTSPNYYPTNIQPISNHHTYITQPPPTTHPYTDKSTNHHTCTTHQPTNHPYITHLLTQSNFIQSRHNTPLSKHSFSFLSQRTLTVVCFSPYIICNTYLPSS